MSRENLELVERFYELDRQREWKHLELMAEDVVYRPIAELADSSECRGRSAFRRFMEHFWFEGEWSDISYRVTGYRDHDDKVITRFELTGHGSKSGAGVSARVFCVFTIADGEIVHLQDFTDRSEAVAAAGL
jgi:ketosteroid isomerase-like protein